ncbi:hypothetical protein ACNHUS_03330 [Actinomycetes bacterium M1A6_2h]
MTTTTSKESTDLGFSRGERIGLTAFGVVAGGGLGALLPVLADIAAGVTWWGQMQGPVEFAASIDRVIAMPIAALVCAIAACVLVWIIVEESVTISITDVSVVRSRSDRSHTVSRTDVGAVFLDEGTLVVLGTDSRQLIRDVVESTPDDVEAAFEAHRYPWVAADPHRALFRRWVPGSPDLPASVNALLKIRETALKKKSADEIDDFRTDAEALGYVIREKNAAQFWRPLVRS